MDFASILVFGLIIVLIAVLAIPLALGQLPGMLPDHRNWLRRRDVIPFATAPAPRCIEKSTVTSRSVSGIS